MQKLGNAEIRSQFSCVDVRFQSYQRVIRTISGECSGVMAVLNEASNLFTQLKVCLDPVRLLRLAHLAV